jgi:hypothetical protein
MRLLTICGFSDDGKIEHEEVNENSYCEDSPDTSSFSPNNLFGFFPNIKNILPYFNQAFSSPSSSCLILINLLFYT